GTGRVRDTSGGTEISHTPRSVRAGARLRVLPYLVRPTAGNHLMPRRRPGSYRRDDPCTHRGCGPAWRDVAARPSTRSTSVTTVPPGRTRGRTRRALRALRALATAVAAVAVAAGGALAAAPATAAPA